MNRKEINDMYVIWICAFAVAAQLCLLYAHNIFECPKLTTWYFWRQIR